MPYELTFGSFILTIAFLRARVGRKIEQEDRSTGSNKQVDWNIQKTHFCCALLLCFKLVSCVFPTLKKETNQSTSVTTVGMNVSFYAWILYKYIWTAGWNVPLEVEERGRNKGKKHTTGVWFHHHPANQYSVYLDVSSVCVCTLV